VPNYPVTESAGAAVCFGGRPGGDGSRVSVGDGPCKILFGSDSNTCIRRPGTPAGPQANLRCECVFEFASYRRAHARRQPAIPPFAGNWLRSAIFKHARPDRRPPSAACSQTPAIGFVPSFSSAPVRTAGRPAPPVHRPRNWLRSGIFKHARPDRRPPSAACSQTPAIGFVPPKAAARQFTDCVPPFVI
jgi:hypothetical protein